MSIGAVHPRGGRPVPGRLDDFVTGVPGPEVSASGVVTGVIHLVDLDQPVTDVAVVRAALRARTVLVVGLTQKAVPAEISELLDLVLTEGPESSEATVRVPSCQVAADVIVDACRAHPRAALLLAAVLRQTALLPTAEALAAEAAAYSTLLSGPEFAAWLSARGPARPARPDDVERLGVTRSAGVLQVRLCREVRRNAFDAKMRAALSAALDVALLDPEMRVELRGDGAVFSAGGDLDEFGTAADPATAWVVRVGDSPAHSLARLAARTTAYVHGSCAGAGIELPAFAGRIVADNKATFRLPELAMGLLPGAGGTVSLPRRIGRWRTLWLGLTGLPLDAETALRWGLVDTLDQVAG